jgi:hypothetical protein
MARIEILNGAHIPPHAFMVVDGYGLQVDLSNVVGELWDQETTARVDWGLRDTSNKVFGRVILKNGQGRPFYDIALMKPYLIAYEARAKEEKAKHDANVQARQAAASKAAAKRDTDDAMVRAARAQAEQEMNRA